jgi:hypothetical protein
VAAGQTTLGEVIESYPRVHRIAMIILGAFTFRSWKSTDSLLTALEVLRQLYASGERKLPARGTDRLFGTGLAQADRGGARY